jgi:hypothetical protein
METTPRQNPGVLSAVRGGRGGTENSSDPVTPQKGSGGTETLCRDGGAVKSQRGKELQIEKCQLRVVVEAVVALR